MRYGIASLSPTSPHVIANVSSPQECCAGNCKWQMQVVAAAQKWMQHRTLGFYRGAFRKQEASNSDSKSRRWSKRAFQRRSSEVEVRLRRTSLTGPQGHSSVDGPKSPTPSRRRSSSIAVARPTPDLHRFLQAEAGPWGHLSPSPRSPTRTPAISPGAVSTSSHLSPRASPGGPSPTTPPGPARSASGSRGPAPQRQYRGRTSSMPAVPRHKVSHRMKHQSI
ncbi:hypothetical protein K0M31_016360 [Melipona bicolor]|uniref:Uncharacterized protein n=1 Tax=Melipona bicolor TaxID=60889 RepID=A0AA40KTE3_9HYME|nr:hypothetical protein K0M31_016360 [Melipona bicolor]